MAVDTEGGRTAQHDDHINHHLPGFMSRSVQVTRIKILQSSCGTSIASSDFRFIMIQQPRDLALDSVSKCCNNFLLRGCIQKSPDWPPGARTANGPAPCH
jgi:hypothetical protein